MIQIPDAPAVNPASGQICAMLALDIAGFTRPDRDEEVRIHIHKALYEILREALQRSGLPWDRCHHEDRGDGALVVAPPDIPAHGIIDPFPERLRSLIRVHNRMSAPAARIQVRASAHIGPVYRDDHGLVGDDINMLFWMLDAKPVHAALAGGGAELALVISPYMYESLVRRHPALAGPARFRPINTQVKGTRVNAWIHLPGVPSPLPATGTGRQARASQFKVKPQRLVQSAHEHRRHPAHLAADSFDRHRADLLGLRLGVLLKAGVGRPEQNLLGPVGLLELVEQILVPGHYGPSSVMVGMGGFAECANERAGRDGERETVQLGGNREVHVVPSRVEVRGRCLEHASAAGVVLVKVRDGDHDGAVTGEFDAAGVAVGAKAGGEVVRT